MQISKKVTMKIKYLFLYSILIVSMTTSCYREPIYSDAHLDKDKMINILADIHLAEAKIAGIKTITNTERDSIMSIYYQTIFNIHNVKAEDFDQSLNSYMKNPKELSFIYEKVLEKLQKVQTNNIIENKKSIDSK